MIWRLRQIHRRTFTALSVLLPAAFLVGVAMRKPFPAMESVLPGLAGPSRQFNATVWERAGLFTNAGIRVRLLREAAGSGRFALSMASPPDFAKPDLMVYWVAGSSGTSNALPESSVLLGSFAAGALELSAEAVKNPGTLVLYSLADGQIVDVSGPVRCSDSGP